MASKNGGKSVMGNLPSTRSARIGGRREAANGDGEKRRTSAAAKTTREKAPASAKPTAATSKPRAVRSGSPGLKAAQEKALPPPPQPPARPKGTELVTTAVQAAGELAQIGLTVGGQIVKRATRRLPRP
jgi:hypothetical protein